MSGDPIRVNFNAARMCEAIARIGYEPHTAILDLVDNAVTAEATEVKISLHLLPGKTLRLRNSVRLYQIVDNGKGMDERGVQSAFDLGFEGAYGPQSLSKYGLGLKSAGLSLGSRISIVSKQSGKFTKRYTFDKDEIAKAGEFIVLPEDLNEEQRAALEKLLPGKTGTLVEIEGCDRVNHPSPSSTVTNLKKQVGVVYYSYLTRQRSALSISIRACPDGKDEPFEPVLARDMLYEDIPQFKKHFNPENYDYASPYLVLNEPWKLISIKGEELPPITVRAVVFPTASMAALASPLSKDEKALVASYEITEDNKGFFIYRNGRLIRWGDDLKMITRDDRNLRIRMDIETAHDDVLHVDVSKQRLEIDDESMAKLKSIIGKALSTSRSVMEDCKAKLKKAGNDEGSVFNETVRNVGEDDPDESSGGAATEETQKRRRKRAEEGAQVFEQVKAEEAERSAAAGETSSPIVDVFKKVVYTSKVPYGHVWKPQFDATEGVFVCISNQHPFYLEVLSRMPQGSVERLCSEALIFAAAVGESNVRDNLNEISPEDLERVFGKFHKNIGSWLNDWTTESTNFLDRND